MLAVSVDWGLLSKYQGIASPWTLLPLVIVTGVSAWLIFQVRAWFRDNTGRTDDKLEMLTQFRELRQQGELSEDEYRLIKNQLVRATAAGSLLETVGSGSAKDAIGAVQRRGGTEKAGEAGWNDPEPSESRTSGQSPNLNSTTQAQSEIEESGMSPE